jgi:hypothetical protein
MLNLIVNIGCYTAGFDSKTRSYNLKLRKPLSTTVLKVKLMQQVSIEQVRLFFYSNQRQITSKTRLG